jgi:predicted dithiol-disulfide oxidoreductase (DUF899 family)
MSFRSACGPHPRVHLTRIEGDEHDRNADDRQPRDLAGADRGLRVREKAHTRKGDAIAAARRWLPMVDVDPATPVVGAAGEVPLIDTFEGRSQLFASYRLWYTCLPAADQRKGCTFNTGHVLELSYLHSRDVTFEVFCQGPCDESARYRDFMGWEMPWYSVPEGRPTRCSPGATSG